MHYTYAHITADTKDVFYIGKGQRRRAWSTSGRSAYWKRKVKKHGFEVIIVHIWKTEAEALAHEVELISACRKQRVLLCNITDGGEGANGLIHSDATKKRIAEARIGKTLSAETRAKLSAALTGLPKSEQHCAKMREQRLGKPGRPVSEATKRKLAVAKLGKPGHKPTAESLAKRSASMKATIARKRAAGVEHKFVRTEWTEEKRARLSKSIKAHWDTVRRPRSLEA